MHFLRDVDKHEVDFLVTIDGKPWFAVEAKLNDATLFLLIQLTRLGTILYLLSLAIQPVLGGDLKTLIIVVGGLVIIYPMLGGTEGVIWTGALQSLILKFSLGSFSLTSSLSESTFWVVLAYGFITNLQNFGIDQAYVQRFITASLSYMT